MSLPAAILLVALTGPALQSCQGAKKTARDANTIETALASAVSNFYLRDSLQKNVWNFNMLFAQTLFVRNESLALVGDLAVSFSKPSPLVMRAKLRPEATFHDGSAVTCADVVWSYDDANNSQTPYTATFDEIKSWTCRDGSFEFHLRRPVYGLIERLVTAIRIYPAKAYPAHSANPTGSGPYKLVETSPSKSVWRRHSGYRGALKPQAETLVFHYVPDARTRYEWLRSGKLDVLLEWPADLDPLLAAKPDSLRVHQYPASQIQVLGFSARSPCFKDLKNRQAVARVVSQYQPLLEGFAAATWLGTPKLDAVMPTPLTSRCGQTMLTYPSGSNFAHSGVPLLQKLKETLNLGSSPQESSVFFAKLARGEADAFVVNLPAEDDAISLFESLHSSQFPPQKNRFYYKNLTVDRDLQLLQLTDDPAERQRFLARVAEQVQTDMPLIALGRVQNKIVAQNDIQLQKSIAAHPWLMLIEAVKKKDEH